MNTARLALRSCLLLGLALGACRTDDGGDAAVNDVVTPPADRVVADSTPGTDATSGTDSTPGTDATTTDVARTDATTSDVVSGASVTMAVLTNPAATGHPANRSVVAISDTLVALSPRLFISQSTTTMKCLFAAWVGTSAGGDFSAIEVTESLPPPPTGSNCFDATEVGNIPANLAIGDTLGPVSGEYEAYCPSGTVCPMGVSNELDVSTLGHGTFSVTGHGGALPTPTAIANLADISGMGGTAPARAVALQNGLVTITGTIVQTPPSAANHNVMMVSTGSGATPTMPINISTYPGVTCQRTVLLASTAGFAVGSITGVLEFSFNQWVIQPRQSADLPGVICATDGGTPSDASADAAAHD